MTRPGGRSRPRILVVDDDDAVRRAVARSLEARYDVVTAPGGRAALDLLDREAVDLVVSDIAMPDGSGPDLHAALEARRPDLARRMVFMTGDALSAAATAFLPRVPNRCLAKPLAAADLAAAVAEALGGDDLHINA
jgi:CheY-like chemotaxis protein